MGWDAALPQGGMQSCLHCDAEFTEMQRTLSLVSMFMCRSQICRFAYGENLHNFRYAGLRRDG